MLREKPPSKRPRIRSKNEKLVVLKVVYFLTINYVIVLSSILFGYGTFICINTIDIIPAASSEFGTYRLCEQRRFTRACASAAVSPEPSLLAHTSSESRGTFRQKARSLARLNGWACAVKICHDGMLEDTNSLDAAHFVILYLYK